MTKKLEKNNIFLLQKEIRDVIQKQQDFFKSLGIDSATNKIMEILKPFNEIPNAIRNPDHDFLITPPVNRDQVIREIVREELKFLKKDSEPQIEIVINNGCLVTYNDSTLEIYPGGIDIIRILSKHNRYMNIESIMEYTSFYNTNDSLRKSMAKLNKKFSNNFGKNEILILGKRGLGYMINPRYRIVFKK